MQSTAIITKEGHEIPYQEGLVYILRHLALENDVRTPIYAITMDEEDNEVKTLIATLSTNCPQHACEIPFMDDVKFVVEGEGKVHAFFSIDFDENDFDDMDEEDMEGYDDEDMEDFEDIEDDGEFEELPVKQPKIEEVVEKKPKQPIKKDEPKKVEKKEAKKPEPVKEQPKKEEPKKDKKKNKKNKNKNKK